MNTPGSNCKSQGAKKISFPFKGGWHSFQPEQIIRLRSESNYTYIYTTAKKPILMAKVLGEYESLLLPLGFIRTHRSHLINKSHIVDVSAAGAILMDDASTIEISRRKRKDVLRALTLSPQAA